MKFDQFHQNIVIYEYRFKCWIPCVNIKFKYQALSIKFVVNEKTNGKFDALSHFLNDQIS